MDRRNIEDCKEEDDVMNDADVDEDDNIKSYCLEYFLRDDYDDFWMKSCYKANFWPGHRILKVNKKKMIRISLGIYF